MDTNPVLIEPGVKYFLCKSLKSCYNVKTKYYEMIFNVGFLLIFISMLGLFILYKKKYKITDIERNKRIKQSKTYLLDKIKRISLETKKKDEELITNIPKFESSFVQLHKKYYTI